MAGDSIIDNPWAFANRWYNAEQIHDCIKRTLDKPHRSDFPAVPRDVESMEFAEWLTSQYRLAMAKGAQLAIDDMRMKFQEAASGNNS